MNRLNRLWPCWALCAALALFVAATNDARAASDSPLVAEAQERLQQIERLAAEYNERNDRIVRAMVGRLVTSSGPQMSELALEGAGRPESPERDIRGIACSAHIRFG